MFRTIQVIKGSVNVELEIQATVGYMNIYLELLYRAMQKDNREEIEEIKGKLRDIRKRLIELEYLVPRTSVLVPMV